MPKANPEKPWGVVLIDYPVGIVMTNEYYTKEFATEEEAERWCRENPPDQNEGTSWAVYDRIKKWGQ